MNIEPEGELEKLVLSRLNDMGIDQTRTEWLTAKRNGSDSLVRGVRSSNLNAATSVRAYRKYHELGVLDQALLHSSIELNIGQARKYRELAAFERDCWMGLADLGLTYENAVDLVSAFHSNWNERGTEARLNDCNLALTTPEEYESTKIRALRPDNTNRGGWDDKLQTGSLPIAVNTFLLVSKQISREGEDCAIHREGDSGEAEFERLTYTGNRRFLAYFESLIADHSKRLNFDMHLCVGKHLVDFSATARDGVGRTNMHQLIDEVLSTVLWTGRPLRRCHISLFLPLSWTDSRPSIRASHLNSYPAVESMSESGIEPPSSQLIDRKLDGRKKQAVAFFSPRIAEQIFNIEPYSAKSGIAPIREYEVSGTDLSGATLKFESGVSASVEAIKLFRHPMPSTPDLLQVELTMPEMEASWMQSKSEGGQRTAPWWQDLFSRSSGANRCQLETWLDYSRLCRIAYPTFPEQWKENKITDMSFLQNDGTLSKTDFKTNEDLAPIIKAYLSLLLDTKTIPAFDTPQVYKDDRMFISVAYALAGSSPGNQWSADELERVFSIAIQVDRAADTVGGGGRVYDDSYSGETEFQFVYTRWRHLGSIYGFTDHSHVYMGMGSDMANRVASYVVPEIYERMTMLNLFHIHHFNYFEKQVSKITPGVMDAAGTGEIRKLRDEYMEFTNKYWFHEVTHQNQGKEIYQMQCQAAHLQQRHEVLQQEIQRTEEYLQAKFQDKQADFQDKLTRIGLFFTFIALVLGITGIPLLSEAITKPLATLLTRQSSLPNHDTIAFTLSIPLVLIISFIAITAFRSWTGLNDKQSTNSSILRPLIFGCFYLVLIVILCVWMQVVSAIVAAGLSLLGMLIGMIMIYNVKDLILPERQNKERD